MPTGAHIREARELDVEGLREIFIAAYGRDYAYPEFYDLQMLKKIVFDDDTLMLVAEDEESGILLGTGSVIFDIGAYGDLMGEFGRLVVHPDARGRGIGNQLMEARLQQVEDRLHLAIVENRAVHALSQRISARYGFAPVGLLPLKLKFGTRESVALYARHFGESLELRRNHPRVVPEAVELAELCLGNSGVVPDVIADDRALPYPPESGFTLEEFTTRGYASLLRIERGRVSHREVFGPARLHQGLFKLRATHSNYLLAKEKGRLVGAIGFSIEPLEKLATVFEITATDERPVHFLLDALVTACGTSLDIEYVELDVNAYAPRMQRTLLELGFLPVAYIPAFAFQDVERLDALKMARLFVPFDTEAIDLCDATLPVAEAVTRNFTASETQPRLAAALPQTSPCNGLNTEQALKLAAICQTREFAAGETMVESGQADGNAFIILEGEAEIAASNADPRLGIVKAGECLGETILLHDAPYHVFAKARTRSETAVLNREDLQTLARRRPDIAVILYQNLARGLGEKLSRVDDRFAHG